MHSNSQGLIVKNLTCLRNHRLLFRGINFTLNPGEVLHIHGENGVGKSSLLRILCGLLEPAEGEILWQGQLSSADSIQYKRNIGYLGHKLGLKDRLTVAENIKIFIDSKNTEQREQLIDEVLNRMGIFNLKNHLCETLSAGQKQRTAISRLLAKKCTVWLLDEPFTSIDIAGIDVLETVIQEHINEGGMVVLTSHQPVELKEISIQMLYLTV